MERCADELRKLTGKSLVYFTDRGNTSILLSLRLAASLGKTRLGIQDQGGWLTYRDFAKKLRLPLIELKTEHGSIDAALLEGTLDSASAFLVNSMPGYFFELGNMKEIFAACRRKNSLLINDASGSIGTGNAKIGDIILGSFGREKPVEAGYGGFLAFDLPEYMDFFTKNNSREVRDFSEELSAALHRLPERREKLIGESRKIKRDLDSFDIIEREGTGYNVIVRFRSEEEKLRIIHYCTERKLEYTLCPRYIRVLEDAVSIEVKRID